MILFMEDSNVSRSFTVPKRKLICFPVFKKRRIFRGFFMTVDRFTMLSTSIALFKSVF